MLRIYFLFFFFISLISFSQVQNYEEGEVVADFTVTDINGEIHNLYTYTAEGKYVFIDFFYKDCGGCQILAPIFNEFYDKYGCNQDDLVCILMNRGVDNDVAVIEFEELYGGDFHHAPAISRNGGAIDVDLDLNPYAYPTVCIIAPDNTLLEDRVWPINNVEDIESYFPEGFTPEPLNCTLDNKVESLFAFEIFPNPANGGIFNVRVNDFYKTQLRIIDLLGKEVYKTKLNKRTTRISLDVPKGIYFLELNTAHKTQTSKLLIE